MLHVRETELEASLVISHFAAVAVGRACVPEPDLVPARARAPAYDARLDGGPNEPERAHKDADAADIVAVRNVLEL